MPPLLSVGERRGHQLAPLNTDLSRPNNSSPVQSMPHPRPPEPGPNGHAAPAKRQSSKTSLRILFGRDKPSRRGSPDSRLTHLGEMQQRSDTPGAYSYDAPVSPSVCTTPKTAASTPTFSPSPTASHGYLKKPPPKTRTETGGVRSSGDDPNWKPPPLFQAYPQAIRHECLPAPSLSADSILRVHATARANSKDREGQAGQRQNHEFGDPTAKKKVEKKKHLRSLSETIGKADWIRKIYVLATSGYILQYSGEGKHDRLPEKILQLGPKSVAFASDAIPGKHWVLQVSQNADDNTAAPAESHRPLLSRFGLSRSHPRRFARAFLLVFSSPEEMSSWLLAVRAEIEARGGKKYVSERVFDDGEGEQLRSKTSARQLVKRDPNRFSNVFLQPQSDSDYDQGLNSQSRRSSYHSFNRRSYVMTESRSGSASTARTDGPTPTNAAEPLYTNGSLSYPESAATSPPIGSDTTVRGMSSPYGSARMQTRSPPISSPKQRQSVFMQSKAPTAGEGSRVQAQAGANPLVRSASPPAPNFSVPSFSKRFAARTTQSQTQQQSNPPRQERDANITAFPSPPQSPTRSTSSFDRKEPDSTTTQHVRKPLRVSNSDASLGSLAESVHKTHEPGTTRTPKPIPSTTSYHHHSNTTPDSNNRPPTTGEKTSRQSRISILPNHHGATPAGPSRRKSMPGLAGAGPPSAPPPNYPLPKIPSPVTATQPPWPGAAAAPAGQTMSRSPPPVKSLRRISTMQTAGMRTASSRHPNGNANGIRE